MIQIRAVKDPFTAPGLARQAVGALARAEAMGLLPAKLTIEVLDLPSFKKVIEHIARAGLAQAALTVLAQPAPPRAQIEAMLTRIVDVLDHSPVPEREWPRLADLFGIDRLGELLGISASSLRRYKARARSTPDDVAGRLHFLALVVADLAGAYSEPGVRRWFERKRSQLGGRAPRDLLHGDWDPNAPGPTRVRELAQSLVFAPAT
ncbi:MAG: hypothetical protein ACREM3_02535 [Candidatus Rokuibacteriota bacterium]